MHAQRHERVKTSKEPHYSLPLTIYVHVDNTEPLTKLHPKSPALLARFGQSQDTKSKEAAATTAVRVSECAAIFAPSLAAP